VRILGLEGLDYRQLRRLFRIVRQQAGLPVPEGREGRRWARFSFQDLVALKAAVQLAGGEEALNAGKRLRLADVEHICSRLRGLGIASPLTEIAFSRRGKAVVARVDGLVFEALSGQVLLAELDAGFEKYLRGYSTRDTGQETDLRQQWKEETMRWRQAGSQRELVAASIEVLFS
jgi:hypothetical protein